METIKEMRTCDCASVIKMADGRTVKYSSAEVMKAYHLLNNTKHYKHLFDDCFLMMLNTRKMANGARLELPPFFLGVILPQDIVTDHKSVGDLREVFRKHADFCKPGTPGVLVSEKQEDGWFTRQELETAEEPTKEEQNEDEEEWSEEEAEEEEEDEEGSEETEPGENGEMKE
jgi:hypothetical protein